MALFYYTTPKEFIGPIFNTWRICGSLGGCMSVWSGGNVTRGVVLGAESPPQPSYSWQETAYNPGPDRGLRLLLKAQKEKREFLLGDLKCGGEVCVSRYSATQTGGWFFPEQPRPDNDSRQPIWRDSLSYEGMSLVLHSASYICKQQWKDRWYYILERKKNARMSAGNNRMLTHRTWPRAFSWEGKTSLVTKQWDSGRMEGTLSADTTRCWDNTSEREQKEMMVNVSREVGIWKLPPEGMGFWQNYELAFTSTARLEAVYLWRHLIDFTNGAGPCAKITAWIAYIHWLEPSESTPCRFSVTSLSAIEKYKMQHHYMKWKHDYFGMKRIYHYSLEKPTLSRYRIVRYRRPAIWTLHPDNSADETPSPGAWAGLTFWEHLQHITGEFPLPEGRTFYTPQCPNFRKL